MKNLTALLFLLALGHQDEKALSKDKTGMKWTSPFPDAKTRAEKEGRLLLIKPIAFGTNGAGGW